MFFLHPHALIRALTKGITRTALSLRQNCSPQMEMQEKTSLEP